MSETKNKLMNCFCHNKNCNKWYPYIKEVFMTNKHDIRRDACQLFGGQAKKGCASSKHILLFWYYILLLAHCEFDTLVSAIVMT